MVSTAFHEMVATANEVARSCSQAAESADSGQRQARGDVECLTAVEAVLRILGIKTDRAEAEIRGGVNDLSAPRQGAIGPDE